MQNWRYGKKDMPTPEKNDERHTACFFCIKTKKSSHLLIFHLNNP